MKGKNAMKIINARIVSVLCAAVLSCAALAGCSKSENTDSASKSESGESKSDGDKKAEIFIDEDGIPYYFDKDGYVLTGWQYIGEKWYYLEPEEGKNLGHMWADTVTPDGHRLDETGARID